MGKDQKPDPNIIVANIVYYYLLNLSQRQRERYIERVCGVYLEEKRWEMDGDDGLKERLGSSLSPVCPNADDDDVIKP